MFGLFKKKSKPEQLVDPNPPKPYEPTYPVRELLEAVKGSVMLGDAEPFRPTPIKFTFNNSDYAIHFSMAGYYLLPCGCESLLSWLKEGDCKWLREQLSKALVTARKRHDEANRQKCIDILTGSPNP